MIKLYKTVPLLSLKRGEQAKIVEIMGGITSTQRLAEMGLTSNTKIKILRNSSFRGPVELYVRGSRLVIGRGLAAKILVKINEKEIEGGSGR